MCVANIPIKFIQIDTNYKNCTIILRIYIYINYQRLFIALSLVIIITKLILIDFRFFFFFFFKQSTIDEISFELNKNKFSRAK